VIAVVQPHRYSRLRDLFEEFCSCFNKADIVVVADVYEAGERSIAGFDKVTLAEGIKRHGHNDVHILEDRAALAGLLAGLVRTGDYVVCMGAGDITTWAYALPGEIEAVLTKIKGCAA
jgi:UDP-N-acetylmuramate--alanine ligase